MQQERKVVGLEDLVLLSQVDEPSIVSNLDKRFAKNEIYTSIGNVLVSCNPFRPVNLYEPEHIKMYENGVLSELPPHVYAVAESAFRTMISEDEKQCIIISGESGSGKTEVAKQIMSYVAAVSGSGANDEAVLHIKNVVLDSNPALESWGNAMTLRNNNSSRFGKYFSIQFELANGGTPQGGTITNYLLEKSRIVRPGSGERSFHIFYQLLTADSDIKGRLGLGSANDYRMLSQTGVTQINNEGGRIDDAKEFPETVNSMNVVGVNTAEQFEFFRIVAIALHLSNIGFVEARVESAEGSKVRDARFLDWPASLLGVDPAALDYALTYRTLDTSGDSYQVPMNPTQANAARDALSKDLYARAFDLLVLRINSTLADDGKNTRLGKFKSQRGIVQTHDDDEEDSVGDRLSIGVLDIFGFEIFDVNKFEQFCINFVNEKLQQVFINLTIKSEQEDYAQEGIQWIAIPFFDNQIVCELIEGRKPPGVFSILDDTCKTLSKMSSVDDKFLDTLKQFQSQHKHFSPNIGGFVIKHYAGDVQYTIDGFIEANKDILGMDLQLLAKNSTIPFIQNLYHGEISLDNRKQPTTAGYKIKTQSADLVYTLLDCNAHYVRCIKSNDRKKGGLFDTQRVTHQVRYLGLLENIKVRRAGFAFRMEFFQFINRYRVLTIGKIEPRVLAEGSDAEITQKLLQVAIQYIPLLGNMSEVQMGKTKLFIKTPNTVFELQKIRKRLIGQQVVKIQNLFRRYMTRKDLLNLRGEMSELWKQQGKESTPTDLVRPFSAFYIKDQAKTFQIGSLLELMEGRYGAKEKLHYTDEVQKLNKSGQWEQVLFFITDRAFYYGIWQLMLIGPKPPKGQVHRQAYKINLRRRTALSMVESLSLSKEADDMMGIHVVAVPRLAAPDKSHFLNKDSIRRCMETQTKFSFFGRHKHRCNFTGGIYIRDMVATKCVIPDKGFYTPVEVHHSVVGTISTDMQEDVVLLSDKKSEMVSMIRDLVSKAKGFASTSKSSCKALYDYQGDPASGALAFRAGDVMELVASSDANWWTAVVRGQTGIVPANYVEKIPASNSSVDIRFANGWTIRSPPDTLTIEFFKAPSIRDVMYQYNPGKFSVSVPPGVSAQLLIQVHNNQRTRAARKETERKRLNEIREENAKLREAQRLEEKRRRLEARKERRAAEKNQRQQQRCGGSTATSKPNAAVFSKSNVAAVSKPNVDVASKPNVAAVSKPKFNVLWQEIKDPSSGNFYYYNSETGATQWEKPVDENLFPLDELLKLKIEGSPQIDLTCLESNLRSADFQTAFGMEKAEFDQLPKWKQDGLKKKAGLY